MILKLYIYLLVAFLLFGCGFADAQHINEIIVNIPDKESLDLELDNYIEKKYYEDSSAELKIVFTLKVDSLGEIHSAHIRWSRNLKLEAYYTICHQLESKYRVKFIFDKYKDELFGERYVICRYPYFSD